MHTIFNTSHLLLLFSFIASQPINLREANHHQSIAQVSNENQPCKLANTSVLVCDKPDSIQRIPQSSDVALSATSFRPINVQIISQSKLALNAEDFQPYEHTLQQLGITLSNGPSLFNASGLSPFCDLRRLRLLNLSGNSLSRIAWESIRITASGLVSGGTRGFTLDLSNNDFRCEDCSFAWLANHDQLTAVQQIIVRFSHEDFKPSSDQNDTTCKQASYYQNYVNNLDYVALNYSTAAFFGLPRQIANKSNLTCQSSKASPLQIHETCGEMPKLNLSPTTLILDTGQTAEFDCQITSGDISQISSALSLTFETDHASQPNLASRLQISKINEGYHRMRIANLTSEDSGWVVCSLETPLAPAVALGLLLVRSKPKIRFVRHDTNVNSTFTHYADFEIQSYVRPCVNVLGMNMHPKDIQWSKLAAGTILPRSQTCGGGGAKFENRRQKRHHNNGSGENAKPLTAPFVHRGHIGIHDISTRTDIHNELTLVACNSEGCDYAPFKLKTGRFPDASNYLHTAHNYHNSEEISAEVVESASLPTSLITTSSFNLIAFGCSAAFILFLLVFGLVVWRTRQNLRKKNRQKSGKRTRTTTDNEAYFGQSIFSVDGSSSAAPLIPLQQFTFDNTNNDSQSTVTSSIDRSKRTDTRSPSLITYLTSVRNSRRSSISGSHHQTQPAMLDEATISWDRQIGEGYFSEVFRATCRRLPGQKLDGSPVALAVKIVKHQDGKIMATIQREAELIAQLRHKHVVHFYGMVLKSGTNKRQPTRLCLAFEFMRFGDLKNYLRKHGPLAHLLLKEDDLLQAEEEDQTNLAEPAKHLPQAQLLAFSLQIASALAYLDSRKFIHRDIAARNCLVGENLIAKLSDFGMSKDVYDMEYYKTEGRRLLPVRWLPPESFQLGTFNAKTDIWSFGVLLWEIFAYGRQPWTKLSNPEVIEAILDGQTLERPEACPEPVYELMRRCWEREPGARISAAQIEKKLGHVTQLLSNEAKPTAEASAEEITYTAVETAELQTLLT